MSTKKYQTCDIDARGDMALSDILDTLQCDIALYLAKYPYFVLVGNKDKINMIRSLDITNKYMRPRRIVDYVFFKNAVFT